VFYDYELLYPRPFGKQIRSATELTKVEPPLLYGVIRQESLFRTDAASAAGALGLAQLLPATARQVAREWQQPEPAAADLLDPAVNLTLGAARLRDLMNRFGQQTSVALAGYNAGERAVERWLPAEPIDADIWTENIPYNETRDYVQRVLWHSIVFGWLESDGAERNAWLAQVAPLPRPAPGQPAS
jgi:soluble lytic murein transglycosylase